MTDTATIFQCADCLRYFIAGPGTGSMEVVAMSIGEQAAAAMNGRITPLAGCARADCAQIKTARVEREKNYLHRFHRGGRKSCAPKVARLPENYRSPCPPEREFDAEEAAAFATAPESVKEAELNYDALTSALDDFLRVKNFGRWFLNFDLVKMLEGVCGRRVNNFNNVTSKLRARYAEEVLDLDVDTVAVRSQKWRVRVCAKKDSLRLQRENPRRRLLRPRTKA